MPNGAEWIAVLAPIAADVYNKLKSGQRVTIQEQMFALQFTLVEVTKDTREQLVDLRNDFNRLCGSVEKLNNSLIEVAKDAAWIRGKLS